jgi:predicted MFS family arabinose efflux permease
MEPLIPPRLFRDRVFAAGITAASLNSVALFTASVFIPLYFQLVKGVAPAQAGLMVSPLMGGVIVSSILGGRLVSKTGRYKVLLVLGPTTSMLALSSMSYLASTGRGFLPIELSLVALGVALGLGNPTLIVAIQNTVEHRDLGIATSVTTFFRTLGGASGVALSGSIMSARLHTLLPGGRAVLDQGVQHIATLPDPERLAIVDAYRHAIATTFFTGSMTAMLALFCVLLIPERPLRSGRVYEESGEQSAET